MNRQKDALLVQLAIDNMIIRVIALFSFVFRLSSFV